MGLTLSDQDLTHYQNLVSVLLSPIAYETPEAWTGAACRALMTLCDTDSAAFILPQEESVHLHVDGMDSDSIRKFRSFLGPPDGDGNVWRERRLDQAMRAVRDAGLDVFTSDDVAQLTGIPPEKQPYYQEVLKPSGICYTAAMAFSLLQGRAIMSLGHESRELCRFGDDEPTLLRLLLPVFHAAVLGQRRLACRKGALAASLDELGDAVAIFDRRGEPQFRNRELAALSDDDLEFDLVRQRMRWLAREVGRPVTGAATATSDIDRRGSEVIETGHDRYSLTPTILPAGMILNAPAILIIVRAATPRLPSERQLRKRFGLTNREAEVALLLASGHSNREMAAHLEISPHTARHHAQRVLEKVGAPSRKALGLRFLRCADTP